MEYDTEDPADSSHLTSIKKATVLPALLPPKVRTEGMERLSVRWMRQPNLQIWISLGWHLSAVNFNGGRQ